MDPLTIGLGVASLGGQLFGAAKGGQANNANDALLKQREEESNALFKSRINRDFLQTNAAKGVLEKIRKQYENNDKGIASRAAITGASDEAVVAQKTANNENLNDATSNIAEGATAYQDNAENQFEQSKNAMLSAKMNVNSAKAANAANLASNAGNLLGTAAMVNGMGTTAGEVGRTGEQTGALNQISQSGLKGLKTSIMTKNRTPLV